MLYGFGNGAAYVTFRAVADSLFLSHIGTSRLPLMYMISASAVILASGIHARAARMFRLHDVVFAGLAALAIASFTLPKLSLLWPNSLVVFGIIYVASEIRGALGTIHFATLINESFEDDEPHAFVGWIGLGTTLSAMCMGLVIALLVDWVQSENLLYLAAVLDVATMAMVVLARRGEKSHRRRTFYRQKSNRRGIKRMTTGMKRVARSHYVLGVVGLVVLTVAVSTLVEFQWKVTAAGVLHRDEHDLTAYFGYYYAGLYLLTGLLQVFLTGRLLQRFGPIA
mgnify:CR=1 FL=1